MIDITKFKPFFPLKSINDVENLFKCNIDPDNGSPNLTLLSIVVGLVEHSLVTINNKDDLIEHSYPITLNKYKDRVRSTSAVIFNDNQKHLSIASSTNEVGKIEMHHYYDETSPSSIDNNEAGFLSSEDDYHENLQASISSSTNLSIPEIEFEVVETLYRRFVDQIKNSIDLKDPSLSSTNLKIKKISDILWFNLSNSYYKDKAHLQSIFSYLTTNKLDCFGLAFAVISACQILNLKNIYLALSEDHAWVMFDPNDDGISDQKVKEAEYYVKRREPVPVCALYETCEVTWHGKANSDKRGQPVSYKNSWLYTNGYSVKCDTHKCVAALVSSINPSINSNTDSEILALIQQRLLWLLFKSNHYFPMSLGNLGELEDICPTENSPKSPLELFHMGIDISKQNYNDSHVYPYTYLASFFFRNGRFKEALETWTDASNVMTKYNYSKDDEEIYKEFYEVANDLIPSMLKVLTAGGLEPGRVSKKPFLQDPECLALILKTYDNICIWEEGSTTPVWHINWAKSFVSTLLKFSAVVRAKIKLWTDEDWKEQEMTKIQGEQCSSTDTHHISTNQENGKARREVDDIEKFKKRPHSSIDDSNDEESEAPKKVFLKKIAQITSHINTKPRYFVDSDTNVHLILKSQKLIGSRALLLAPRLNTSAIQLQLSAQSQCVVRGQSNNTSNNNLNFSTRSKRLQR